MDRKLANVVIDITRQGVAALYYKNDTTYLK